MGEITLCHHFEIKTKMNLILESFFSLISFLFIIIIRAVLNRLAVLVHSKELAYPT